MQQIKNNDDTSVTIKTFLDIDTSKTFYYLKFTDSSQTNTKILELLNTSTAPKHYSRFLVLQNSNIPTGRGTMQFYASNQTGLTTLSDADLINTQDYELIPVSTFEIVQYSPEKVEYIYYNQQ